MISGTHRRRRLDEEEEEEESEPVAPIDATTLVVEPLNGFRHNLQTGFVARQREVGAIPLTNRTEFQGSRYKRARSPENPSSSEEVDLFDDCDSDSDRLIQPPVRVLASTDTLVPQFRGDGMFAFAPRIIPTSTSFNTHVIKLYEKITQGVSKCSHKSFSGLTSAYRRSRQFQEI
eukprot:gb/GECG01004962.1/.p1 GENE.gb/GECG01004962.1/~~gb/GECG01004962.1/.p1  ORF type:complete len:175 (+),score=19.98 gb/GECG01004962.1/:1-525(+)